MTDTERKKVPPNGGWGWMIVIGSAISGMSTIPILQGLGLIFKDTFPKFGFSATEGSIIINTNLAFGMLLGLVNGPLLRHFGYRKVAIGGTLAYTVGVCMTAFATTFPVIMISYGIFASAGMGVTVSAFSYALNSYFTTKRGRATGLSLTITGLGPIIMPVATSMLISYYGYQGTMLLYGSFTLHGLIGSLLLHPLKWHLKDPDTPSGDENLSADELKAKINAGEEKSREPEVIRQNSLVNTNRPERKRKNTISSIDHDTEVGSIYGFDTPLSRQLSETWRTYSSDRNENGGHQVTEKLLTPTEAEPKQEYLWWSSARSINTINLGSSMRIFEELQPGTLSRYYSLDDLENTKGNESSVEPLLEKVSTLITTIPEEDRAEKEKKTRLSKLAKGIVDFYDLTLLLDPIYVNIMIGMSIAIFAEINFSLLTPFILGDMGLSTTEIASVMSVVAGADLIFRSLAPFLGEWMHQPPRRMYLLSLFLLIISRTSLIFASSLTSILFVGVGLGVAKGVRSVYMLLVVPCYVPIERLPYASGIQMIINGIILMCAGPVLGIIRDHTGSYTPCIILMNSVTALTITMWVLEMIIVRWRNQRKKFCVDSNGTTSKT